MKILIRNKQEVKSSKYLKNAKMTSKESQARRWVNDFKSSYPKAYEVLGK